MVTSIISSSHYASLMYIGDTGFQNGFVLMYHVTEGTCCAIRNNSAPPRDRTFKDHFITFRTLPETLGVLHTKYLLSKGVYILSKAGQASNNENKIRFHSGSVKWINSAKTMSHVFECSPFMSIIRYPNDLTFSLMCCTYIKKQGIY